MVSAGTSQPMPAGPQTPCLAESWSASPDGLTYTFKLRDDVTFCSGKKMTAKDVVATYERWLDPETKGLVKWRMGDVDKISAPDDVTVEYKLKKPFSELLYQMTQYIHTILNVEQAKQLGADFGVKAFDGTGPYCLESWTPRDSTVLTKHAGYKWGPPIYDVTEAQAAAVAVGLERPEGELGAERGGLGVHAVGSPGDRHLHQLQSTGAERVDDRERAQHVAGDQGDLAKVDDLGDGFGLRRDIHQHGLLAALDQDEMEAVA